jgi:hypothetical protein
MAGREEEKRPEGAVAVALFSVSAGVFAMGVASLINQALNPLQWEPVPGVTPIEELQGGRKMLLMWSNFAQMASLFFVLFMVWMIAWMVLHESFARRRTVSRRWYVSAVVLLAAGLVLSFPPFYQWVFPQPVSGPLTLGKPFTSYREAPKGIRVAMTGLEVDGLLLASEHRATVQAPKGIPEPGGVVSRCPP